MRTVSSACCISMLSVISSSSSVRREARFAQHSLDHADQVLLPELARREVDRDPQARMPRLPRLRLRAGFAQHPFADRHDEAGLLGERDELGRRHQPMVRLLPAQQRLGADDAAAGEVDLRLVVQRELAALERAAQVGLGRQAAAHALVHLRAEELVVAAPRFLGVVHRGVGVAHQRLRGVAVVGIERDADAGRHVQLVPSTVNGSASSARMRAATRAGFAAVGDVGQADDELVAAQARHGVVLAQAGRQPRGHRLQQLVADAWPSESLTFLKRSRSRNSTASLPPLRCARAIACSEAVGEQRAVGQAGERVVVRHVHDALVGEAPLVDLRLQSRVARGEFGGALGSTRCSSVACASRKAARRSRARGTGAGSRRRHGAR